VSRARRRWAFPAGAVLVAGVALVLVVSLTGGDDDDAVLPSAVATTAVTGGPASTGAPSTTAASAPTTGVPSTTSGSPSSAEAATTAIPTTAPAATPTTTADPLSGTEPEPEEADDGAPPDDDGSGDPPPAPPPRQCTADTPVRTGTRPGPDDQGGRRWVTVGELHGACDGTGVSFHVGGIDTRLVVRSDAPDVSVFVVDDREGEDATAGFPDASCSRPCAFEQAVVLRAADYHLRVAAGEGPWEVYVEEYRAP
jgi:hypothetical protein